MKNKIIHNALLGVAIGDALGVPVEFRSREQLKNTPVTDYLGYMCWNQPPGTWSDDTSLTLCLAESLVNEYDINDIAKKIVEWYKTGYWGAHHKVFDIGGTTRQAIDRLIKGESPLYSGNMYEEDNGNGSLMRILPIVFYLKNEKDIDTIYKTIKEVSGITHAHFRSVFACFIYIILALELLNEKDKNVAYSNMQHIVNEFVAKNDFNEKEMNLFNRILKEDISTYKESSISSSGYVLHSLEASIWCLMTEKTFTSTTLKAVNLGDDTDTTGAIAGGLAGLLCGYDAIPQRWIDNLARIDDIKELCDKLEQRYGTNQVL